MISRINTAQIVISLIFIITNCYLIHEKQWVLLPTFWLSCLTTIFSYLAYEHTKEKFRLDLYKQRLEFNNDLILFLSHCLNNDITPEKRDEMANKCVQGLGMHKAKTLFGEDVVHYLHQIHDSYCNIITYRTPVSRLALTYDDAKPQQDEYVKARNILIEAPKKIPDILAPYIYFGSYKI